MDFTMYYMPIGTLLSTSSFCSFVFQGCIFAMNFPSLFCVLCLFSLRSSTEKSSCMPLKEFLPKVVKAILY